MAKFYVYKTYLAEIMDVMEVEAENEESAILECNEGNYEFIGTEVIQGLSIGMAEIEALPKKEENIPQYILKPEFNIENKTE